MRAQLFFLTATLVVGAASSAHAGEAIKVDLVPKAQKGQGQPELIVKALAPLSSLTLDVKRSDGKAVRQKAGSMAAGREHKFQLPLDDVGSAVFKGTLAIKTREGDGGEMPIDVKVELLPQLELTVLASDVDLANQRVKVSANRALDRVQVSLMSDSGAPLGTDETGAGEADADGKYTVDWKASKGTILRISLTAWDETKFFGGVDLFPWRVDIPHEEVNFRSGSFEIEASEQPKLDESFKKVSGAVSKFGKLATIKLFIAGHTDTVGDAGSNRALSDNRARAIGRWFKKRGIHIPISYAGFGEDILAVETPDETDEGRNRRAEYIVAVEGPTIKSRAVTWRPLD